MNTGRNKFLRIGLGSNDQKLKTQYKMTFETLQQLQSDDNLFNFNQTSGSLMTSNNSMMLSQRLANAAMKHSSLQSKWN